MKEKIDIIALQKEYDSIYKRMTEMKEEGSLRFRDSIYFEALQYRAIQILNKLDSK